MAIFYPGDDNGGGGTVTVNDVEVKWTITIIDPENPTQIRNPDPDNPHGVPYAEHIPFILRFDMTQSVGTEMTLTIDDLPPFIGQGDTSDWIHTHRFTRVARHNVHLWIRGGNITKEEWAVIEALPVAPLDSDRLVIRIRSVAATTNKEEFPGQLGADTTGDQA